MFSDAGQYLGSRLRKLRDETLGLPNLSVEASSQSANAEFEVADLTEQFVLGSRMVPDGSYRKSLSAFFATS